MSRLYSRAPSAPSIDGGEITFRGMPVRRRCTEAEAIRLLRDNNPFLSSVSAEPWDNDAPDLPELNAEAAEMAKRLISAKASSPKVPMAGLVLGEAGSGKTHMLRRILRSAREDGTRCAFASVSMFLNPENAIRKLFTDIFTSLGMEISGGVSQLDMIIVRLREAARSEKKHLNKSWLIAKRLNACKIFTDFIIKYISAERDDERKLLLLEWLKNGADEGEAALIGLPRRDLGAMSVRQLEDEARDILIALGQLLGIAGIPLVVCFDQLDGMEDDVIKAWESASIVLIDKMQSVLPIAFLRFDNWERFARILDPAVKGRFQMAQSIMKNCTQEQARRLIRMRIDAALPDDPETADTQYKWLTGRLGERINGRYSPRIIIQLANKALTEDMPEPHNEAEAADTSDFSDAYADECAQVSASLAHRPADADEMMLALRTLLEAREDFSDIKMLTVSDGRYRHLTAERAGGGKMSFIVLAPSSWGDASSALRKCREVIKRGRGCFYIADGRVHRGPDRWKKVASMLDEFRNAGGCEAILSGASLVSWYALAELIKSVKNGDVTMYPASSRPRPADLTDLRAWLREGFPPAGAEGFDFIISDSPDRSLDDAAKTADGRRRGRRPNDAARERTVSEVRALLRDAPMPMMSASRLAEAAGGISREELLKLAGAHGDIFRIFTAGDDIIIGLY